MATAAETALIEPIENSGGARAATSLFSVIWQRKSLVILGIVISLVLGSLFYAQRQPLYQSVAQILVVKKSADVSAGTSGGDRSRISFQEDYMSSQTVILKSQVIAERTVLSEKIKKKFEEQGHFRSFPDATKPDELVPDIIKNLTVTRENKEAAQNTQGNNVILLTFRATDREEAKIILENLIAAYQSYIDETYKDINENVIKEILKLRDEGKKQIEDIDKKIDEFKKNAPIITAKIAGGTSEVQKFAAEQAENLSRMKLILKSKQFDLETMNKIYKEKGPTATIQYILSNNQRLNQLTGDPETDRALLNLKLQESELLANYGERHPKVISIRSQIGLLKQDLLNKEQKSTADRTTDLAKTFIDNLEIDVTSLQAKVEFFTRENEKTVKELRELSRFENEETRLTNDRLRTEALQAEVMIKVRDSDMKKDSGGFKVATITRPGVGIKVSPIAYQVFAAAGLLGILLGVGLAYLAEISDKSFRNPSEIRRRLGLPVIGHVPFLAADEKAQALIAAGSTTVDPMLITHYQSGSIGAEAYRGVRTALYFSTQGAGHQVIQVTSPNVSDGKSTLAANLAVSIAQSGKRTLLVDCDFRKPRVHKIFNVPATVGMASVMVGQADLNSAAQPTVIPNLSVMPCGPRPANPAELLTSPRFKELLEELRTKYDFVLVDTPPVLVVTDPSVVAPRVDGVVLCIRVTKNGRPYAERAREVLASMGANVLGVVVNGFGTQVGGNRYGYEHYSYGEGYSYTYGYTYGYADKEAASYYAGTHDDKVQSGTPASKS
jgi:capsular exopolysaccharide synthesis family protein